MPDLAGKRILVTGANSGIGKETALSLAGMGARVVLHGRRRDAVESAAEQIRRTTGNEHVESLIADLSSLNEVRRLAGEYCDRYDRLDVLIHNAGLIRSRRELTMDGYECVFAVNHLAPFLLTRELDEILRASGHSRVVTVSSVAHARVDRMDFDDLMSTRRKYVAFRAYGYSKLANILFTRELARRLAGTGVTANCLHPGLIRTGFGGGGDLTGPLRFVIRAAMPFLTGPRKGAATSIHLASSPDVEGVTCEYFVRTKVIAPSAGARNAEDAARLWEESERLCG